MNSRASLQVFIHPAATVLGLVEFGTDCSVWPGAVLRGDMNKIVLGKAVNIQDNTTIHTDSSRAVMIGDYTLVGHNAMLHGCTIGKAVLIGIGCTVHDEAVIGDGAMVMANCVIRGKKKIPPFAMVVPDGNDIKIFENKAKTRLTIAGSLEYIALARRFQENKFGPFTAEEEAEFLHQADIILRELFP